MHNSPTSRGPTLYDTAGHFLVPLHPSLDVPAFSYSSVGTIVLSATDLSRETSSISHLCIEDVMIAAVRLSRAFQEL
jgi:hypothetical protein